MYFHNKKFQITITLIMYKINIGKVKLTKFKNVQLLVDKIFSITNNYEILTIKVVKKKSKS